jgi:predicted nucleic acid-binding protein
VNDVWVVNASPVITLARINHLHLLTELATAVWVTDAVAAEIVAGPDEDPARLALESGWGSRVTPLRVPDEITQWSLGLGESSVLALAAERGSCTVVLDDASARMCARTLGIPLIGTLGVVLRARRVGIVSSASQILRELRGAGLYLDDATIRSALRRVVGETWAP